jgi:ABC-type molybdate transport system ATPase subunit
MGLEGRLLRGAARRGGGHPFDRLRTSIGRNGAGKTTLLKILSRITEPTEGYAEIHGRVGSLLEVGTQCH